MKLFNYYLLAFFLPAAIKATTLEDDYIHECQVQYGVTLGASYPDKELVGRCSDVEMQALLTVVRSVVSQDYIASMLGNTMPEFMLGWETFKDNTKRSSSAKPPSAEAIAENTPPSVIAREIALEGCGQDNPNCEGIDDIEDEGEEEDDERRRLAETDDPFFDSEWTPMMQPIGNHGDSTARDLQWMDCPGYGSGCSGSMWCCTFCSTCYRRRRQLRDGDENKCKTLRVKGGRKKLPKNQRRRLRKFEKRVSAAITAELQLLATRGAVADPPMYLCLGKPWELKAKFRRHIFKKMCDDESEP